MSHLARGGEHEIVWVVVARCCLTVDVFLLVGTWSVGGGVIALASVTWFLRNCLGGVDYRGSDVRSHVRDRPDPICYDLNIVRHRTDRDTFVYRCDVLLAAVGV
jgi:hypothetical protein